MAPPCSNLELEGLFDLCADLLCVAQFKGVIERVNFAWERTLGFKASGVTGLPLSAFIHPNDWDAVEKVISNQCSVSSEGSRAAAGGLNTDDCSLITSPLFECRCRTRDGGWRWLEWSAAAVPGQPTFFACARDITDRKRAEAEILKLAAFPRVSPNAIFEFSGDGRLTYFNDAAMELTRALGESHPSAILPPNTTEIVCACLVHGESRLGLETTLHEHALSWSFHPVVAGGVVHCYATDNTEKKKLEMQFLRAQRLESIGTLAGGVAHDLNNILAPILMSVNLLRESLTDPDDRRLLETLHLCAQRGADMVKQILAFTRGRHGGRGVISLSHLVSEWAAVARETFPRSIRIEIEAGREIWNVHADATQIYQLLMNLCVNARDAMPVGGDLAVALRNVTLGEKHRPLHPDARPGQYVRLMVTDTGIGIAPEQLDQIWETNFSVKPPGGGTGLGLASVLSIAKGHGGFVHVDSRIGQGSCFEIFFPAASVPEPGPGLEPEATFSQGRGQTILVVDDERAIQEFTSAIFARHGYRVLTAGDGNEALALFAQQKDQIDLVLTDMMMPCLDGFATIRGLQRIKPGLRVIVTSGLAENEAVAGELGRASFLLKPFTTERLLHAVSESLRAP